MDNPSHSADMPESGYDRKLSAMSFKLRGCDLSQLEYRMAKNITPGVGGRTNGMGYMKTAFFLVATMLGAGFLALPKAIVDSGWLGIFMMALFAGSVAFTATRLGKCWIILEERWPEYRLPARQPYMAMAERTFGPIGRKICLCCVIITLMGYGVSFVVIMGQMMSQFVPSLSNCEWMVIVTLLLWPATFFGTPKDFWQASVLAVVATYITGAVIVVQLFVDIPTHPNPQHPNPTVTSFSLGFSAILFAFGGASVFPTLQNDMEDRRDWWKTVAIGFTAVVSLYMPVGIIAYVTIGSPVNSNVLVDLTVCIPVTIAIILEIVNLLATYIIDFNPVGQAFEDILLLPTKLTWKRIVLRSALVLFELMLSLAIPDFGSILNLIGGSTITMLSFIFPPLMYIRLIDMKSDGKWEEKTMPLWERVYLWMIVIVAVVGGITSTVSAVVVLIDPDTLGVSCFTDFFQSNENF